MREREIVKIMFLSIGTVSTNSSIWIKIKPNENAKQHKIGTNQMEFQNVYVLQFVKSFYNVSHKMCMS
jgi:hypothetical protein